MKNIMLKLGLVALLAGIMTACTPAQSQLTTSSVKDQATIIGYIKYNAGAAGNAGDFVYNNYEPASGVEVEVRIPYSYFGDNAQGNYSVIAKTNDKGYYEVTVPVPAATIQVNVSTKPFEKSMGFVVNDKIEKKNALYPRTGNNQYLTPGDKVQCNLNVNGAAIE